MEAKSIIVSAQSEGLFDLDWFVQMMKKAAPKMSQDDLKTIEAALRCFKRT